MKMRSVTGFTLIELVVVIAILAILSVIALPKFIDLRQQAVNATAAGIAGSLASGSAINYAARVTGNAAWTTVSACTDSSKVISQFPTGSSIAAATLVANGASTACTLNYTNGGLSATSSYQLMGAQ